MTTENSKDELRDLDILVGLAQVELLGKKIKKFIGNIFHRDLTIRNVGGKKFNHSFPLYLGVVFVDENKNPWRKS